MAAKTLHAHFDGNQIRLDEPFDLEPNAELLITVLPKSSDAERTDWAKFSLENLARAYGDDEPAYSLDSIKEANRYLYLRLMERRGEIRYLLCQPIYELEVNGMVVGKYIADFRYEKDGRAIVEDVKSKATRTTVYMLKKRLMLACHAITVTEV